MSALETVHVHHTVRRALVTTFAAVAASAALGAAAAPASAAPSCAGVIFSAVATSGPQAVSDRIAEIKRFPDVPRFGVVASQGLARADFCKG